MGCKGLVILEMNQFLPHISIQSLKFKEWIPSIVQQRQNKRQENV